MCFVSLLCEGYRGAWVAGGLWDAWTTQWSRESVKKVCSLEVLAFGLASSHMETWITSDVHLGARQCRAEAFCAFLRRVPPGVRLVLNGDVITRLRGEHSIPPEHVAALDLLRALSLRQDVIWIAGNHDRKVRVTGEHNIQYHKDFSLGTCLYVGHGDQFDHLSRLLRFLLLPVRVLYEFSTRVIGSQTHVADFAKRFPAVYEVLNGHVVRNATSYAQIHGFGAVTCGHTHHAGTRVENGVTYYNTGCWTEDSSHVLVVKPDGTMTLQPVSD